MISSAETNAIIPALREALSGMEDITKSRKAKIPTKSGGEYSYTFADLSDVLGYARPKLAAHGLAVMQEPFSDDKGTVVVTTVLHESGQWIESRPLRLPAGVDAQSHGSSITFGRRYQLLAQLGLATEDDDGAAAKPAVQKPTKPKDGPSEALTKRAMAMFGEAGIKERADRLAFTSQAAKRDVTSWSEVTGSEAADVIAALKDLNTGAITIAYDATGRLILRAAG